MRAETAHAVLLLVVLAGLGLAVFATAETFDPVLQNSCSINSFFSCAKIDASNHTTTLGVPDWAIGVAGFVLLLGLEVPLYRTWRRDLLVGVVLVSGLGVVASLYLGYIELAVIGGLCPVCFSTYLADAATFLFATWLLFAGRETPESERDVASAPSSGEGSGSAPD